MRIAMAVLMGSLCFGGQVVMSGTLATMST